jgi:peptidoglycan/LPS O-acetylase OafA/YrhL
MEAAPKLAQISAAPRLKRLMPVLIIFILIAMVFYSCEFRAGQGPKTDMALLNIPKVWSFFAYGSI